MILILHILKIKQCNCYSQRLHRSSPTYSLPLPSFGFSDQLQTLFTHHIPLQFQSPHSICSWQICRPPIVAFSPLCSYSQEITQISLTPHLISQLPPQALPGNTPAMLARESGGLSYLSIFSANSNPGVLTPSL